MSVVYELASTQEWLDRPLSLECFGCGYDVSFPAVCWHGTGLILMHPECAARLGPHLIADAREAVLAADQQAHWRRRLLLGVRHRLEGEERVA